MMIFLRYKYLYQFDKKMLQLEITNTGEYVSLKHEGDKVFSI